MYNTRPYKMHELLYNVGSDKRKTHNSLINLNIHSGPSIVGTLRLPLSSGFPTIFAGSWNSRGACTFTLFSTAWCCRSTIIFSLVCSCISLGRVPKEIITLVIPQVPNGVIVGTCRPSAWPLARLFGRKARSVRVVNGSQLFVIQ